MVSKRCLPTNMCILIRNNYKTKQENYLQRLKLMESHSYIKKQSKLGNAFLDTE